MLVRGGLSFASVSVGGYGVASVSADGDVYWSAHTCGVTTGGDAYCWGDNRFGQLGDGSTNDSSVPVLASGGHSFASVSAGGSHTCGLTTTGAVYCWGHNDYGEIAPSERPQLCPVLRNNRLVDHACSTSPLPVDSRGSSFAAVSAGTNHTCVITTDGTWYCWGGNERGQLGDGTSNSGPGCGCDGTLSLAPRRDPSSAG